MTDHSDLETTPPVVDNQPDTTLPESIVESNMVAAETTHATTTDPADPTGFSTPVQTDPTNLPEANGGGPAPYSPLDMTNHNMNVTHNMLQQLTCMMSQMATQNTGAESPVIADLNRRIITLTDQVTNLNGNDNASTTTSFMNPVECLSENQIYKTVNQRLGRTKFGGAMPGNGVKGPILFQWEMEVLSVLRVLNLHAAIMGEDLTDRAQNLSSYAIMQGLTEEMQTRISAQPRLTTSGMGLWNYLQATYAPKGVAGMIFGLTSMKDATPAKPVTPDTIRKYIDDLRVLWLFNERQICCNISWGCKLEMLFRALESTWASQFKFHLTRRLQEEVAVLDMNDGLDAEEGEALVLSTINEIMEYLATVDIGRSTTADLHYTTGGRGNGRGKGKGKGRGGRRMLDSERDRIRSYYDRETAAERAQRQASRVNDTCGTCGKTGHWRMDPECPGATEAQVTELYD
jgi:hypothetical protein